MVFFFVIKETLNMNPFMYRFGFFLVFFIKKFEHSIVYFHLRNGGILGILLNGDEIHPIRSIWSTFHLLLYSTLFVHTTERSYYQNSGSKITVILVYSIESQVDFSPILFGSEMINLLNLQNRRKLSWQNS